MALANQVVLITGAGGGIGSAAAAEIARRGGLPVLADLDPGSLARAARGVSEVAGVDPLTVALDVTDPDACDDAVARVLARHGRLDVVWANAGVSAFGPLDLVDPAVWRRVVDVNLVGAANTVRAALPAVMVARGYVALTCSWASFAHQPGHSAYAAAKAGLEALGNALRTELAGTGVRVGTFHPGWVDTAMVSEKREHQPAFRALLEALPGPFRATVPVADVVPVLVDGIERRSSRVVVPRIGRLALVGRPLLTTRLITRATRAAAPRIRELAARQVREEGTAGAGMSARYRAPLRRPGGSEE